MTVKKLILPLAEEYLAFLNAFLKLANVLRNKEQGNLLLLIKINKCNDFTYHCF